MRGDGEYVSIRAPLCVRVCVCVCVFLLKRLIGELTCRYPLKGISLVSLLPYKQRNKASVTPVSTPTQRGPSRTPVAVCGKSKEEEWKSKERGEKRRGEPILVHNLMTKGKKGIILLTA